MNCVIYWLPADLDTVFMIEVMLFGDKNLHMLIMKRLVDTKLPTLDIV